MVDFYNIKHIHKENTTPLGQSEQIKSLYSQKSTLANWPINCSYSDAYELRFNAIILCIDQRKCIENYTCNRLYFFVRFIALYNNWSANRKKVTNKLFKSVWRVVIAKRVEGGSRRNGIRLVVWRCGGICI